MAKHADKPSAAPEAARAHVAEKPAVQSYDISELQTPAMERLIADSYRYAPVLDALQKHTRGLYDACELVKNQAGEDAAVLAKLSEVEKKHSRTAMETLLLKLSIHKKKGKDSDEAQDLYKRIVKNLVEVAGALHKTHTAIEKEAATKAAAAAKVAESPKKGAAEHKGKSKGPEFKTADAARAFFAQHESELRDAHLISYDYTGLPAGATADDEAAFVKKMNWASRALRDMPEVQGALASLGNFTIDTARTVVGKDKAREFKFMSKLYEAALAKKLQPVLQNKYKFNTARTVAMNQFYENQFAGEPRIETADEAAAFLEKHLDELKKLYLLEDAYQVPDTKNISTDEEKKLLRIARSKRAHLARARELAVLLPKQFNFRTYRAELVEYAKAHQDTPTLVGVDDKTRMHKLITAVHTEKALDEYSFTLDEAKTLGLMTKNKYFAASRVDPEAKKALLAQRDARIQEAYPEALAYLQKHQKELADLFLLSDHFEPGNKTNAQIVWQAEKAQQQMQYVEEINTKLGTDVLQLADAKKLIKKLPAGEKDVPVSWIYQAALKKATDAGLKRDVAITAAVMARNRYLRTQRAERAAAPRGERKVEDKELKQAEAYVRSNADRVKDVGLVAYNFEIEELLKRPPAEIVGVAEFWKSALPEAQKIAGEVQYVVPQAAERIISRARKGLVPKGVKQTPEVKVFFATVDALEKKQSFTPLQIEVGAVINRNRFRRKSALLETKIAPQSLDECRELYAQMLQAQDEINEARKIPVKAALSPEERVATSEKKLQEEIDDAVRIMQSGAQFATIDESAVVGEGLSDYPAEQKYRNLLFSFLQKQAVEKLEPSMKLEWETRDLPSGKFYVLKQEGQDLQELWKKKGTQDTYVETKWSKLEGTAANAIFEYLRAIFKTQSESQPNEPDGEYTDRLEKAIKLTPTFAGIHDLDLKDEGVLEFIKANGGDEYDYEFILFMQGKVESDLENKSRQDEELVVQQAKQLEEAGGAATELPPEQAVAEAVESGAAVAAAEPAVSAEEKLVEEQVAAEAEHDLAAEATQAATDDEDDDEVDEGAEAVVLESDEDEEAGAEPETAEAKPTKPQSAEQPKVAGAVDRFKDKYRAYEFSPEGMTVRQAIKNMARLVPDPSEARRLLGLLKITDEVRDRVLQYARDYVPAVTEKFNVEAFESLLSKVEQSQTK